MSFFEIIDNKDHTVTVNIKKPLTFKTIHDSEPLREISHIKSKNPRSVTINCSSMASIDSCGLSLINLLKKAVGAKSTKLTETTEKFDKLNALYVSNHHHENNHK